MVSSSNPHFFKVVLAKALKEQKLEIPKKFVREYGVKALFNDEICVKVGDGKEWNVGLTKSNNGRRVWFHNGLQKFVEFYSIKLGYFLVFKYENQSSSFYVTIFDLTAMEIEYPVKSIGLDKAKEMVTMDIDSDDFDVAFSPRELLPIMSSEKASPMAKATAFQSITLNPSFTCKIRASYIIHPGKSLNIPKSFADKHLEESTEAILQVSDGRMWDVRCGLYWTQRMQKRAEFVRGWKKFADDNTLQVGDACVFEMIRIKNSTKICFKVEIFRSS